jgi:hypothetical protein
MPKINISYVIKIIITAIILFLIFQKIDFDPNDFSDKIKNLNIPLYLLSFLGVIFVLMVKSYRWVQLIGFEGYTYNFRKAFLSYLSSFTLGIITPGRLGELLKVYTLMEVVPVNFEKGFRTVFVDRLFDMIFLFCIGLSAALFYLFQPDKNWIYFYLSGSLLITVIMLLLSKHVLGKLIKNKKTKINKLLAFLHSCLCIMTDKSSIKIWSFTLIAYIVFYLALQIIFLSINVCLSIIDVALIFSLVSLVLLLPFSIAGFGTREASLIYLLSIYNIGAETAIAYSLLQFIAFFIWGGLIGLISLIISPLPIKSDLVMHKSKNSTIVNNINNI